MHNSNSATAGVVFAAVLFLSATGSKPEEPPRCRPAIYTKYKANGELSSAQQDLVKKHCVAGMPSHQVAAVVGPTRYVFRKAYVLESSLEHRMPLWVCEQLTGAASGGRLQTSFKADPELARWPHARPRDYPSRSKFAQGHMAPDADFATKDLKKETYFLSNIVPQAGQNFNSAVWGQLEKKVRDWAAARASCWVITGAFIHDPREENEETADGLVEYFSLGETPVSVPTHLYKIIVAKNAAGEWESLAFVFENKSYPSGTQAAPFLQSIAWIEERTGLDFFPDNKPGFPTERLRTTKATELWPVP